MGRDDLPKNPGRPILTVSQIFVRTPDSSGVPKAMLSLPLHTPNPHSANAWPPPSNQRRASPILMLEIRIALIQAELLLSTTDVCDDCGKVRPSGADARAQWGKSAQC